MATLDWMHWILADPQGFGLHTDQNSLIYIFDTTSVVSDRNQIVVRKVLRWAVRLAVYNYTCIHIKGEDNVWADLLGRWTAPTIRRLVHIPALPSSSAPDFECTTGKERYKHQQTATPPPTLVQDTADGLWKTASNAIWIPDNDAYLQLRLCLILHTCRAGHRAPTATLHPLQNTFFWCDMVDDVQRFISGCIHFLSTTGGERMPRPVPIRNRPRSHILVLCEVLSPLQPFSVL